MLKYAAFIGYSICYFSLPEVVQMSGSPHAVIIAHQRIYFALKGHVAV